MSARTKAELLQELEALRARIALLERVNARDVSGRERLEGELHEARGMEAVGRLAGGIAHDFNNLLTVIIGRTQLVLGRLEPGHPLRRHLEVVEHTSRRAAALTAQLLAFGRRQMVQPRVLDLAPFLRSLEPALERVLGESITLHIGLEAKLGAVRIDPAQLEHVIVDLAANARDAMPDGGRLTIHGANVDVGAAGAPADAVARGGAWVALAVTDTGRGMDAATRARVFEPFFTTKEVGQGTGLGLATVYGIVTQAGGHVRVESEPGHGSTFTVYLPRLEAASDAAAPGPTGPAARTAGIVLVVEDEREVLELATEILRATGYTVLAAAGGPEAERVAAAHAGPVDLLLADVVLPGTTGPAIAARLAAVHPGLRVLYMSGFTDRIPGGAGTELGAPLLTKPFTSEELLRRVRDVLGAPPAP